MSKTSSNVGGKHGSGTGSSGGAGKPHTSVGGNAGAAVDPAGTPSNPTAKDRDKAKTKAAP